MRDVVRICQSESLYRLDNSSRTRGAIYRPGHTDPAVVTAAVVALRSSPSPKRRGVRAESRRGFGETMFLRALSSVRAIPSKSAFSDAAFS